MAAKAYGKIRWIERLEDLPDNAKYVVCESSSYYIELRMNDTNDLYWILAQTTPNAMSKRNYVKTLSRFREIMQCNAIMWVVMPPWKYYEVHPEMDIGFD